MFYLIMIGLFIWGLNKYIDRQIKKARAAPYKKEPRSQKDPNAQDQRLRRASAAEGYYKPKKKTLYARKDGSVYEE